MKKYLLAAAAILAATPAAHAYVVQCTTNDNTHIVVSHTPGSWSVTYTLPSGVTVRREDQYAMNDVSGNGVYSWSGRFNRDPSLWMNGNTRNVNGVFSYDEVLYEDGHGHGSVVRAHTYAACTNPLDAPTYDPPVLATNAPQPTASSASLRLPIMFGNSRGLRGGIHRHDRRQTCWSTPAQPG